MSRTIVELGTTVLVRVTYTNTATGALENPTSVTLKVRKPDATLVSPAITASNPSVGVFEGLIPTTAEGTWYARFVATGPGKVDSISFDVKLDPVF